MVVISRHDQERDYIAANWRSLSLFTCAVCQTERGFPNHCIVRTEAVYGGGLRADIAFFDTNRSLLGTIEIIDTHPPSIQSIATQEKLPFAYYRLLNPRTSAKRRKFDEKHERGKFTYSGEPKWLCSPDCLAFFDLLEGANPFNEWEAPRCCECNGYFHSNHLSSTVFNDWSYDPHWDYCIHCAAVVSDGTTQWREPGELAGGDPREWIPGKNADAASLLLAYCDAAFWSMVWEQRVQRLDEDSPYIERNAHAENATASRLSLVNAAFSDGQWAKGAALLSPVGAPNWAAYPDEKERLLAWRPENCKGAAAAWARLKKYRLEQLPLELTRIIPSEMLPKYLYCRTHGGYIESGDGAECPDCVAQRNREEIQLLQAQAHYKRRFLEQQDSRQAIIEAGNARLKEFQRQFDEQTGRRNDKCPNGM